MPLDRAPVQPGYPGHGLVGPQPVVQPPAVAGEQSRRIQPSFAQGLEPGIFPR